MEASDCKRVLQNNLHFLRPPSFPVVAKRAHPDLNQGPADLQSAALTTELYTHEDNTQSILQPAGIKNRSGKVLPRFELGLPDSESGVITVTPQDRWK